MSTNESMDQVRLRAGFKIGQIASDIMKIAEWMTPDDAGYVSHRDAVDVTAVVVKSILNALVADNKAGIQVQYYRDAFVESLDHILR